MKTGHLGALVLLLALQACSSPGGVRTSAELPAAARAAPQRYLVVTVRNPVLMPGPGAASTPHAYVSAGSYKAGSVARRTSRALADEYHLQEVSSWPIALLDVHCLVYAMPENADRDQLLAQLARDRRVESAQPLQTFGAQSNHYNDPYANLQHNIAQMAVAEAHAMSRGANVRVAVIDTGGAVDHPDLPTNILTRNFVDHDDRAFSGDAHGTAVAGVIAAVTNNGIGIVGIAPDARLLLFKACWRADGAVTRAQCNSFTLAQALAAAVEARADVVNLSLAGPKDPLLTRLVSRALDAGIIVVGAVPPDGLRSEFPANIDAVIAVDALESGHGNPSVLLAPGRDVISLAPQGHYDFFSGSSLATAEVSGLVALLRSVRPGLTAGEAKELLLSSSSDASDGLRGPTPNACAALAAMLKRSSCAAN